MESGQALGFALPEGVTRDDYRVLLDSLLVAYDNDYQEVMTDQAALASTLAAVAALDSARRGAASNSYLVFGAALDDRDRFVRRRATLRTYPTSPAEMAALRCGWKNLPRLRGD